MDTMNIIKLVCLFLAIMFTTINVMRVFYKQTIPALNIIIQTVGIFGFVVIQFHLY